MTLVKKILNILRDHCTPILLRPKKFRDMNKEQRNEAIRDATFRIISFLLLPFISAMLFSFALAILSGMLINEIITKALGSYESQKSLRRGCVVLSGSTVLGASLLFCLNYLIPAIYRFFGSFIGLA
ncbi:hypothetical protein CRE_18043 [Caenorhabditis remanei]|uniref:Uncharacterized protein n=1 Tax=Caenorhabditis remanei TaxID=31234 RepID=E3MTY0_CAERE|nr:hypothetical protein CRE_18043 [Caenorhabditis remanei]